MGTQAIDTIIFCMEQIRSDIESFARIRVVGVGGSGKNAVNHMVSSKVKGLNLSQSTVMHKTFTILLPRKKFTLVKI